jgi:hypothetical protein
MQADRRRWLESITIDREGEAMVRLWVTVCLLLGPALALAGSLNCGMSGTLRYCQYDGRVSRAYVNAYDQIIVYFDTDFGVSVPAQVGFSVSAANAATVSTVAKPDFAKMLYASVLAAQAQDKTITLQMYEVANGLLVADRIWVNNF